MESNSIIKVNKIDSFNDVNNELSNDSEFDITDIPQLGGAAKKKQNENNSVSNNSQSNNSGINNSTMNNQMVKENKGGINIQIQDTDTDTETDTSK